MIKSYAEYRSKGRFPSYCWGEWAKLGSCLLRADRPKDIVITTMVDQDIMEALFYLQNDRKVLERLR